MSHMHYIEEWRNCKDGTYQVNNLGIQLFHDNGTSLLFIGTC